MSEKIPQVTEQPVPISAATRALEAIAKKRAAEREKVAAVEARKVWAYGCQRNVRHAGIFFTGDPRHTTNFDGGKWYSAYHSNSEPFFGDGTDIVCQECLMETGEKVPLRVSVVHGTDRRAGLVFSIASAWHERFTHSMELEKLEQFLDPKETKKEPTDGGRSQAGARAGTAGRAVSPGI